MDSDKVEYQFEITRRNYNNTKSKHTIIRDVRLSNQESEIDEILKELESKDNVIDVLYSKVDKESLGSMQIKDYAREKNLKLTKEEVQYGLDCILVERKVETCFYN